MAGKAALSPANSRPAETGRRRPGSARRPQPEDRAWVDLAGIRCPCLQADCKSTGGAKRTMAVKRIVANIATSDPDRAQAFYGNLLGLDRLMDQGWIVTYG